MDTRNKAVNTAQPTMLHQKLSFGATEAYKLLRTNVLFALPDEHKCRIVGVTSSLRGEGKSTTSINLSYTLAETGKRVLLIDADMRLPSVAQKMQINGTPGLSNMLVGMTDAQLSIRASGILDSWFILPAGDVPPNPSELLGSKRMEKLLEAVSKDFDFIVVDLPPVNIVTDALVISPYIDGMIVVVKEGHTDRSSLNNCTRQLKLSRVKILGFVLSMAKDVYGSYGRYKKNRYYKYYKSHGYKESGEKKKKWKFLRKD
ncbi:MAG: CpsD/CapB family tyrosine-protein kinase [Ruminococcaceae bacterium]|nr:CpsD/CapB family tyrosine-protein kinase [Oscillospiraceae bacterium]